MDLHARNAIHRDFKPDNVLVDDLGRARLGDFGLGNDPACTVFFTVSAAGTPGYAAPEVANGTGSASAAADIFSLGATLFHLVTGKHPRDVTTLDPRAHRADVPEDLRTVILDMVNVHPFYRPSAADILERTKGVAHAGAVPFPPKGDDFIDTVVKVGVAVGGIAAAVAVIAAIFEWEG